AVLPISRSSELNSSGMKTSSGARSSIRNAPPVGWNRSIILLLPCSARSPPGSGVRSPVGGLDLRDLRIGQRPAHRPHVLLDLRGVTRSDDGPGHGGQAQRPGDGELADRLTVPPGEGAQALDEREML